jgi:hypothetical protein
VAVLIVMAGALLLAIVGVAQALADSYPGGRTSARQRLIDRNPALNGDPSLRWSVAARRVQLGRTTRLAVGVALLLATLRTRPTGVATGTDRTD